LRDYANFDLVILDEFGFDRIERTESPQAASLLYKLIANRQHIANLFPPIGGGAT
jgi:hypothetical protein